MQMYNHQFSRNVVNNFRLAKQRGWTVFFTYFQITPKVVVFHFMRKDMVFWEAFKHVVCKIERDDRLPGPRWSEEVWRKQIKGYKETSVLEELLNKCLVLTS